MAIFFVSSIISISVFYALYLYFSSFNPHTQVTTIKHDLPLSFPQLGGISVENYKQLDEICFKCYYKWSNKQGCLLYLFSTSVGKSINNRVENVWNCCQLVLLSACYPPPELLITTSDLTSICLNNSMIFSACEYVLNDIYLH